MSQEKPEELWSKIRQDERTLHEILFYSQGPLDGYILGEDVRDLLLKSGVPLPVLSQIWNLADVSKDNVLNVHEFVLIMHLIRAVKSGQPVPGTLPRSLTPPDTAQCTPPPMTQEEREAYLQVFQKLDISKDGLIDAQVAAEMFLSSQLPTETLAQIWDLSDFGRDGKLNNVEFAIACHLLRYAKQGGSLNGPVDIFQYAPEDLSQVSLLASKRRVMEHEERKQRLILLKEKRKAQSSREIRRLDLAKEKLECLQELFEQLKNLGKETEAETLSKIILKGKQDLDEQEEIAIRLKRVHEEVRQETVKIILGEQKFNDEISRIKKDTDELNKRLFSIHTYDTKEADPFQQMLEERKEKRQGSAITDVDKSDVHIPFRFSPFDLEVTPETLTSGYKVIDKRNNQKQSVGDIKSVIADLKEFGEGFMDVWGRAVPTTCNNVEEDEIFMEIQDWTEDNLPECDWSHGALLADTQVAKFIQKLADIKEEMRMLNSEGGRLVFRNSEDYSIRKKSLAEEKTADEGRVQRRYVTDRLRSTSTDRSRMREAPERYSSMTERAISIGRDDVNQAKRALKLKRQSLNFESSFSLESFDSSNQKRKLQRSTTDPVSLLDQPSLSSSTDQTCSIHESFEKHQEKPPNFKKENSSRKDNSSVLTLKSSRRKDDLSLELASIALGRRVQVEAVPKPVSSEKAKHIEQVSCLSSTSEQGDKKSNIHKAADVTGINEVTKQYTPKAFSAKPKASSLLPLTNVLDPVHDKVDISQRNPVSPDEYIISAPFHISHKKENLPINSNVPTHDITIEVEINPRSSKLAERSEVVKNRINSLDTEHAPQRPPRLKKQSIPSKTFQEPDLSSHSVDESNSINTSGKHSVGAGVSESTSHSNEIELIDTQASKTKSVAKSVINEENNIVGHSSNESQEVPRDVSTLRSFFGQNSSVDNNRQVVLKHELKNKHIEAETKSGTPQKNNFTQNRHSDSDVASIPPPLPNSPPPLCPITVVSANKNNHAEPGESLFIVDYAAPITASSRSQNVSELHKFPQRETSKISSGVQLSKSTSMVPSNLGKDVEIDKESPSFQTYSDVRVNFTDPTSLGSNKDFIAHDMTKNQVVTDFQTDTKSHQRFDSSANVNKCVSGNDSRQGDMIVSSETQSLPRQNKTLYLTSSPREDASLKPAFQSCRKIVDKTSRLSEPVQSNLTVEIKTEEQMRAASFNKAELFDKREHQTTNSKSMVNNKNSLDLSRLADTDDKLFEASLAFLEE